MFTKSDFDSVDERLKNITSQAVEQIEVNCDLPPTIDQLEDNNKTYSIKAAILFIDIRRSTYLTESSQAKSMVKIYRSFMRMAVDCVRKNGGVTRQFLGDRIMGVFIDSKDENGDVVDKAVDKAILASRSLQTVIDFSLNKQLKNNVNGKIIKCGIGIDYGKVLVTQVGMYGVENDEDKENEVDCVWVGNTTNYASKYSDIAAGGEIFISNNVYKELSNEDKEGWTQTAKYKGKRLFEGYVIRDYYLDFSKELGNPIKIEDDDQTSWDTSKQLIDGIKGIEELQNKLIIREKELAVLEEQFKKENERLKNECIVANKKKDMFERELENSTDRLKNERSDFYEYLYSIIKELFLTINLKKDFLLSVVDEFYNIGRNQGYSDDEITRKADYYLIKLYKSLGMYNKAYNAMVVMAKTNNIWVYMDEEILKWAKTKSLLWKIYEEIEKRLVNSTIGYNERNKFEGYLDEIKKLRGW